MQSHALQLHSCFQAADASISCMNDEQYHQFLGVICIYLSPLVYTDVYF